MKQQNRATARFCWDLHASPVFPETSGKRLGDSDVEQEICLRNVVNSIAALAGHHFIVTFIYTFYGAAQKKV